MKTLICLCVAFFFTLGVVKAVVVNADCSKDSCDTGLTCQYNACKKKVGSACVSTTECVVNAQCNVSKVCDCPALYHSLAAGEQCAVPVHSTCIPTSDKMCVMNAECIITASAGNARYSCQCRRGYQFDSSRGVCSSGQGLAASFLLVTAIFVTSYLL